MLLLKHVGVRPDVKVLERGCEYGYQKVADFPHVKIIFYTPEIPESGSREVGEPVLGVWKSVSIKRNQPRGLDWGDCELVEQFRDRVLSNMTTRNREGDINCIPHQLIGNRIDLRFQVLTGMPIARNCAGAEALISPSGGGSRDRAASAVLPPDRGAAHRARHPRRSPCPGTADSGSAR